jgi:hypothetical protein
MYVKFAVAVIPVAIYLILIGFLRSRRRPLVTSGWRDTLTLCIAAAGFVAVGPMQLFTPPQAVDHWRMWVWVMLFGLYALAVVQILLSCRPRLIAYGLNAEQFRELLLRAARQVDSQAYWSADVLCLPLSAIQLAMEPTGSQRVHQVVHVGSLRNLDHWIQLERNFVQMGGLVECERSLAGWTLLAIGSLLLIATVLPLISDPVATMAQLKNFLAR